MSAGKNDGVILSSTRWNQSGAVYVTIDGEQVKTDALYNQYCPTLNDSENHCVTGCTNTAHSQILYYWLEKGYDLNLSISEDDYFYLKSDSGTKIYASDNPTHGEGSISEINSILEKDTSASSLTDGDFIAALNYYCGVKNHSNYGSSTSTSYYITTQYTGVNAIPFKSAGFDSYYTINQNNSKYFDGTSLNDVGFSIIRENLDYGEVVSVSVPNHAIYLDGYRYNENTEEYEYHLNYGWGQSSSTKWYTVDEMEEIEQITIDLTPDIKVNVTNTSGTYYGGSIFRGAERINHVQNEKTIDFEFDKSIAEKSIITDSALRLTNSKVNVDFKDFSVQFATTASMGIQSVSDMDFSLNDASICVNNQYASAAISGRQVDVNLDNSWIYIGYSQDEITDIQDVMNNKNGYDITDYRSDFLATVKGNAVSAGEKADTITLTNNSAVFGDISLGGGDNVVTVENGSLIYGGFTGTNENSLDLNLLIDGSSNDAMLVVDSEEREKSLYTATNGNIDINIQDKNARGVYVLVDGFTTDMLDDFTVNVSLDSKVYKLNSENLKNGFLSVSFDNSKITLQYANGSVLIYSSGQPVSYSSSYSNLSLGNNEEMVVYSGGIANSTAVNNGGTINVSSGGIVQMTTVNTNGAVILSSGAAANGTTINSSGALHVYSGATASDTTVNRYGYFGVGNGATVYNTTIDYAGELTVWGGGVANNNTINQYGAIILSSGAVASGTVINAQGGLHVYSGAVASDTTVKRDGFFGVGLGATTYDTLIDYAGQLTVWGGGVVHDNEINQWGAIILSSGAVANQTVINPDGGLHIYDGAVAYSTEVASGAKLGIGYGGQVFNTELDNTATMTFYEGAKMGGWQSFEGTVITSGGVDASGAYVHFELDDRTADQGAILDNMGNFYSVERYSMEVDSDQALGTYNLAGGAGNFSGEITLYVEDGNDCGALSVGETISYNGRNYTLQNNNGTLALNIA